MALIFKATKIYFNHSLSMYRIAKFHYYVVKITKIQNNTQAGIFYSAAYFLIPTKKIKPEFQKDFYQSLLRFSEHYPA